MAYVCTTNVVYSETRFDIAAILRINWQFERKANDHQFLACVYF